MDKYLNQALDFLHKTGASIKIEYKTNGKYFDDDKTNRDIYTVTIKRGSRSYTFDFGQSIMESQHYIDTLTKNTFSTCGAPRTGKLRVNNKSFFDEFCKLVKGVPPNEYDVITCLQSYDVGTFEDFCSNFGYDIDSMKANEIYKLAVNEHQNLCTLFSDKELQQMSEIQ